jgi:2-oxoglutarate ferredoxin oxidoreductase subunit gamma
MGNNMNNSEKKVEIKIGGFGGQGIILSGLIIGKAAAIFDEKHSCLIKSYGPEARGGSCNTQVIVSRNPILFPYVTVPDVLVILSQEAYYRFGPEISEHGALLYEKDLIALEPQPKTPHVFSIPATQLAEELGKKVVTNIVMLGFFASISGSVSKAAMIKAIESTVPKGTIDLNRAAFEKGYEYGLTVLPAQPQYQPIGNRLN